MNNKDALNKLAMENPIIRDGLMLNKMGMPMEDALCEIIVALAESNKKLTKELIDMLDDTPDTRFLVKELYKTACLQKE